MIASPLFWPLASQVVLTLLVWIWLYVTRLSSMIRNRVKIQELAEDAGMDRIRDAIHPSDNFENLFEIPVLFFVLILLLIQTGNTNPFYLQGAWAFVVLRAFHSVVHCTVNRILFRFLFYFAGTLLLWVMWIRFILLHT